MQHAAEQSNPSDDARTAADERCSGTILHVLTPPALAAIAAHLPALDLLRFALASKAAAAALEAVPLIYQSACACALGWPGPQPGLTSTAAAAPSGSGPPPGAPPGALAAAEEAACRALLAAAAGLAATVEPHCLRPRVRGSDPHVISLVGRLSKWVRHPPGGLLPPLVLSDDEQSLLALGGEGAC
jgi:hypothetical protein